MGVSVLLTVFGLVGVYTWVVHASARAPEPAQTAVAPSATPQQTTGPVDVTDALQRGVVLIAGDTASESVAGTGMVLTDDGLVVTNYHVVRSTESLTATVAATGKRFTATVVGRDATADVALLQLSGASGLDTVTIDQDPVSVGDVVVAAGNANGQGYISANRGNVTRMEQSISVQGPAADDPSETLTGLVETNAAAFPGDSGGPMFDAQHEVLGMTTAGTEGEDAHHVYAVPIADALGIVDQIRAGDESGSVVIGPKAFLGVVVDSSDGHVDVSHVESDSPASRAGLRDGDRILTLNGTPVSTRLDLSHILDDLEPGTQTTITWERNGTSHDSPLTVAASPVN